MKSDDKAKSLRPHEKDRLTLAHVYRGQAYYQKGEYNRAIDDFNTALELHPDFRWVYINRGLAYEDKGELDLAIKDFSKAIALKPDYIRTYRERGRAYGSKGEYDKAIADFNKVMELTTNAATLGSAYYGRAQVYLDKGELEQAIRDFSQSIKIDSLPAYPYYHRGIVWLRLQEWENARADFATAGKKKLDIAAKFRSKFGSIADFERDFGVNLPEDIADMLMGE